MSNASLLLDDPGWIITLKAVIVFAVCVVLTIMSVWGERRLVARMQMRVGPNRVGKFGLIQALADGVKLALKEDLIPAAADKVVFVIAPIISATAAFMAFAVMPMTGPVNFFGEETVMQYSSRRSLCISYRFRWCLWNRFSWLVIRFYLSTAGRIAL